MLVDTIRPETAKERRHAKRGIYKGLFTFWTPRGMIREVKRLAKRDPDAMDDEHADDYVVWFVTSFFLKWLALIAVAGAIRVATGADVSARMLAAWFGAA